MELSKNSHEVRFVRGVLWSYSSRLTRFQLSLDGFSSPSIVRHSRLSSISPYFFFTDNGPWELMNNISMSSRFHGRLPPASKAECEVLMMIGLPGAGKTYYAEKLRSENREKQYNVLGTNLILDKMKVSLRSFRVLHVGLI